MSCWCRLSGEKTWDKPVTTASSNRMKPRLNQVYSRIDLKRQTQCKTRLVWTVDQTFLSFSRRSLCELIGSCDADRTCRVWEQLLNQESTDLQQRFIWKTHDLSKTHLYTRERDREENQTHGYLLFPVCKSSTAQQSSARRTKQTKETKTVYSTSHRPGLKSHKDKSRVKWTQVSKWQSHTAFSMTA